MWCWLDGRLLEARDARVSPLDAGWRLGDGVFSTLLAVGGVPQRLEDHVARTLHDASALGITGLVGDRLSEAIERVGRANADAHPVQVLRLVVTRGTVAPDAPFGTAARVPTVAVLAAPAPRRQATATTVLVEGGRRPAAIKSTSWAWSALATATARAAGATTALLHEDGDLLEAAAGNVVVVRDGLAVTPRADGRLLPGTTRAALLAAGAVTEDDVPVADLAIADEVVLVSAVRGAVPVVAVDDTPVGDGTPGPAAAAFAQTLADAGIGPDGR